VFGTLTLWDILVKELYLPFEEHTKPMSNSALRDTAAHSQNALHKLK
jgi:hypothetical protein